MTLDDYEDYQTSARAGVAYFDALEGSLDAKTVEELWRAPFVHMPWSDCQIRGPHTRAECGRYRPKGPPGATGGIIDTGPGWTGG